MEIQSSPEWCGNEHGVLLRRLGAVALSTCPSFDDADNRCAVRLQRSRHALLHAGASFCCFDWPDINNRLFVRMCASYRFYYLGDQFVGACHLYLCLFYFFQSADLSDGWFCSFLRQESSYPL